jgi:hypothetical protein
MILNRGDDFLFIFWSIKGMRLLSLNSIPIIEQSITDRTHRQNLQEMNIVDIVA